MWFLLRQREPFRPCRPLLLRRPKVVFFGAQAEKPRLFFFFRRRLVMVFGGQLTFSTPQKQFRPRKIFGPPIVFCGPTIFFPPFATNHAARHTWAPALGPILKGGVGGRGGGSLNKTKTPPPTKTSLEIKISASAGDQSALLLNRRFSAPKTKNRLFRRAPKEQRPKPFAEGTGTVEASTTQIPGAIGMPVVGA